MNQENRVFIQEECTEETFNILYEKSYRLVYYIISRLIKDQQTVHDLIQDTYISAFQNMSTLGDFTFKDFQSWINRIATNKAIDYLKKKKPVLFSDFSINSESSIEEDLVSSFEMPDVYAVNEERSALIQNIMDKLSDEQRICVMMFYYQEMTSREIAEILGISENSVKSRLRYARNKIKGYIMEETENGFELYASSPLALFVYGIRHWTQQPPIPALDLKRHASATHLEKLIKTIKSIFTSPAAKTAVALTATSIAATAFLVLNTQQPQEPIDKNSLFSYLVFEVNGYDGEGTAHVSTKTPESEAMTRILEESSITLSKETNLSNDDSVSVTLDFYDSNANERRRVSKTYTVFGLEQIMYIRLEDHCLITFSGNESSGTATAEIEYDTESEAIQLLLRSSTLVLDKATGLSNGDHVLVTVDADQNGKARFENKSFTVVVSGLEIPKTTTDSANAMGDVIYETMKQYLTESFITQLLTNTEKDYHGYKLDFGSDSTIQSIQSVSYKTGKVDEAPLGFMIMEITYDDIQVRYALFTRFSSDLSMQTSTMILSTRPDDNFSKYVTSNYPNVIWVRRE